MIKNYIPTSAKTKPVLQINIKTGEIIKEWSSAREAGTFLDITVNGIQKTCRGTQKTCGGYSWKYK